MRQERPTQEASEDNRDLVKMLNRALASSIDLSMQAKHAHWNVKSRAFVDLHQLFDRIADHADDLRGAIDACVRLGDVITENLLIEHLDLVEMDTWFLEAHLEDEYVGSNSARRSETRAVHGPGGSEESSEERPLDS
jgi:DNA-binding ferritin-like protein